MSGVPKPIRIERHSMIRSTSGPYSNGTLPTQRSQGITSTRHTLPTVPSMEPEIRAGGCYAVVPRQLGYER
jgi:hypothetical protein